MLNTKNKRSPGVSDLFSATALFFQFFILAFCHLVALWLMFTNSVLTWVKEKERERQKTKRNKKKKKTS